MGETEAAAANADAGAQSWETEPVLYARDGSPVPAGSTPNAAAQHDPSHVLGGNDSSRMYILELYQKVIEERDALTLEVASLRGELERARATLADSEARIAELEARSQSADQEREQLRGENVELAGRLTTAQIRRLQAEKMLLELRIAQQRALDSAPANEGAREGVQKP